MGKRVWFILMLFWVISFYFLGYFCGLREGAVLTAVYCKGVEEGFK